MIAITFKKYLMINKNIGNVSLKLQSYFHSENALDELSVNTRKIAAVLCIEFFLSLQGLNLWNQTIKSSKCILLTRKSNQS